MENGTQMDARVEVTSAARASLRAVEVGVLVTSVPTLRPLRAVAQALVARTVDALRVRPPPSRSTQVIGGSVTGSVALPFRSRSSDEHLKVAV